jgi:hypothetical protein
MLLYAWIPMLRLLFLGLIVTGVGLGLQHGWIQLNWDQFYRDLGIRLDPSGHPDLLRSYPKPKQSL